MLAMWDRYGVWVAVYAALVLFHGPVNPHRYLSGREVVFYSLFLPVNLTLSIATLCGMALRRIPNGPVYGALVLRWLARWILYTVAFFLTGFTFFGSWLHPTEMPALLPVSLCAAAGLVFQHIRTDLAAGRRTARA